MSNAVSREGGPDTQPAVPSPYHEGEQALQTRANVRDRVEKVGQKVIRSFMPDEHRALFETLPMLLVGSLDAQQQPWASILTGAPGFLNSPDPWTLEVHALAAPGDPLPRRLTPGAPVGLLGIELETRRRNRMNGYVAETGTQGFTVAVSQSFGNCPQYIAARRHAFIRDPKAIAAPRPVLHEGPLLSGEAARMVRDADTFFIASAAPRTGGTVDVDVSHRGGKPGFVRLTQKDGHSVLTVPDFLGNYHFATLGNLSLHPRAGLLFVDFASGDLLSLAGEARIIWEGAERDGFAGAQRLLHIRIDAGFRIEDAIPLRWSAPVPEPHVTPTGAWNLG